jgi:prepilin-type N-terminal cleavage/methylation domain-containing protein
MVMKQPGRAFSMVELIVVVLIIAILVAFAMPQFTSTRERAFDNEAKANLKLIQAAEKIYRMEIGGYYGPEGDIAQMNSVLRLSIPLTSKWDYNITDVNGTGTAARTSSPVRTWTLPIAQDDPGCSGTGCP